MGSNALSTVLSTLSSSSRATLVGEAKASDVVVPCSPDAAGAGNGWRVPLGSLAQQIGQSIGFARAWRVAAQLLGGHWSRRRYTILALVFCGPSVLSKTARAQAVECGPAAVGRNGVTRVAKIEYWPRSSSSELILGVDLRVAFLGDGSAIIADRAASSVFRVDRTTGTVTLIAGKGQGPGEVGRGVIGVVVSAGDTVNIVDASNHRVTRLSSRGVVLGTIPFEMTGIPAQTLFLPGFGVVEVSRNIPQRGRRQPIILTLNRLGSATETLRTVRLEDAAAESGLFTPSGVAWPVDSTSIALASGVLPTIQIISVVGASDRVVTLSFEPPKGLSREIAQPLAVAAFSRIPGDKRTDAATAALDAAGTYPYYPQFARGIVSSSGSIWLQRTYAWSGKVDSGNPPITYSFDDLGGRVWQQFRPTGAYVSECRVASDWHVLGAASGQVLLGRAEAGGTLLATWRPW